MGTIGKNAGGIWEGQATLRTLKIPYGNLVLEKHPTKHIEKYSNAVTLQLGDSASSRHHKLSNKMPSSMYV